MSNNKHNFVIFHRVSYLRWKFCFKFINFCLTGPTGLIGLTIFSPRHTCQKQDRHQLWGQHCLKALCLNILFTSVGDDTIYFTDMFYSQHLSFIDTGWRKRCMGWFKAFFTASESFDSSTIFVFYLICAYTFSLRC